MEDFKLYGLTTKDELIKNLAYEPTMPTMTKKEKLNGITHKVEYINLPCAFDIETSSFEENGEKKACMYIWQLGINGRVIVGRTWKEFTDTLNELVEILNLGFDKRLIIFVHNLAYEFAWIKKRFKWNNVFSREKGSPIKALTTLGIEFRCSYMLSGCSLEQTCNNLTKYKLNKKVGDLDYSLIRTPITPLTDKELNYCIYDVLGVLAYVQEEIEQYGGITKIPLTNTGKVRVYCRKKCFSNENKRDYAYIMSRLKLTGIKEYEMLKRAFTAGFTHANFMTANETWEHVSSKDLTSSYPTVMICEKFPMSRGQWVKVHNIMQIENMSAKDYYCVFNIRLKGLKEKPEIPDHYISLSKCKGCINYKVDNGRLISADQIETTITSDDWAIIKCCYDYKEIELGKCIRYQVNYLPRVFVQCVIDFYNKKSTLKSVPGEESNYALFKSMLNSCFGMCVTDIISDEVCYEDEWITNDADGEGCIEEYNKSRNRFLYYPWGIAICSKSRRRLWEEAILPLGQDYLYSDTDSCYYLHGEKYEEHFEEMNKNITEKIKRACHFNKLNFEETQPKNAKGEVQPIGVCDDNVKGIEADYRRFKTLGAKRYMCEYMDTDGLHISTTIAGASKKLAGSYIADQNNPFEFFTNRMSIDKDHSGRLIHRHIDEAYSYTIKDYTGKEYSGEELSGIHMEASEYNLSISKIFMELLNHKENRYL